MTINEDKKRSIQFNTEKLLVSEAELKPFNITQNKFPFSHRQWLVIMSLIKLEGSIVKLSHSVNKYLLRDLETFEAILQNLNYCLDLLKDQSLARKIRTNLYLKLRTQIITKFKSNLTISYKANREAHRAVSYLLQLLTPMIKSYYDIAPKLAELLKLEASNYDPELCLAFLGLIFNILYYHSCPAPLIETGQTYLTQILNQPLAENLSLSPPITNQIQFRLECYIVEQYGKALGYDCQLSIPNNKKSF